MLKLCNCFTEIDPEFLEEVDTYTGIPEWHTIYTVMLGDLVEDGTFDWKRPELDWSEAAYNAEQYERVCAYFIERYRYDEISTLPVKRWMLSLKRRLVYELMPKYKPLYERVASGIDPYQESDEYHKRRLITSDYPETLLSQNADYASDGQDLEYETLKEGDVAQSTDDFKRFYKGVDNLLLDDLEVMFIQLYTANVNGL